MHQNVINRKKVALMFGKFPKSIPGSIYTQVCYPPVISNRQRFTEG